MIISILMTMQFIGDLIKFSKREKLTINTKLTSKGLE